MSRNWFNSAFWSSNGDAASLAAFAAPTTAPAAEAPAAAATPAQPLNLAPVSNTGDSGKAVY
jgi:hypothetical protein